MKLNLIFIKYLRINVHIFQKHFSIINNTSLILCSYIQSRLKKRFACEIKYTPDLI